MGHRNLHCLLVKLHCGKIIGFIGICIQLGWTAHRCGFQQFLEYQHSSPQARAAAKVLARRTTCTPETFYDSVEIRTTEHFRILYTRSGPHAPVGAADYPQGNLPYIDTLAHWLEKAWHLHVDSAKMKAPQGPSMTHHYQDTRYPDLYPVEVIDLGLLRDGWDILGGPCEGCYGLTLPEDSDHKKSSLLIDNDFLYQRSSDRTITWSEPGEFCQYTESKHPIISYYQDQSINYAEQWSLGLQITAIHELYHGCQLRYQDYNVQYHIWFEASAVGVEDLGAPDVNDYYQYLPTVLEDTRTNLLDYNDVIRPYGQSIFFHYLSSRLGFGFDRYIWESLQKAPTTLLETHLTQFTQHHLDEPLGETFHDYARKTLRCGSRAQQVPTDSIWYPDLPEWPEVAVLDHIKDTLILEPYSFAILPEKNLTSQFNQDNLRISVVTQKDTNWLVISSNNLRGKVSTTAQKNPRVWPLPWRGKKESCIDDSVQNCFLCFDPAQDGLVLEIRDRRGVPITTLKRSQNDEFFCFDGRVKNHLLPAGTYLWRLQGQKAIHRFLVIR